MCLRKYVFHFLFRFCVLISFVLSTVRKLTKKGTCKKVKKYALSSQILEENLKKIIVICDIEITNEAVQGVKDLYAILHVFVVMHPLSNRVSERSPKSFIPIKINGLDQIKLLRFSKNHFPLFFWEYYCVFNKIKMHSYFKFVYSSRKGKIWLTLFSKEIFGKRKSCFQEKFLCLFVDMLFLACEKSDREW